MADAIEPTKPCPECGGTLKSDAGICRHCGYVFGQPLLGQEPDGETAPVTTGAGSPRPRPGINVELIRFALPMVVVLVLAVVAVLCLRSCQTRSWAYGVGHLRAAKRCDQQFAEWLQQEFARSGLTAYVIAADGECLVNLTGSRVQGLLNRLGMKLGTTMMAAVYAAAREAADEPARGTVVLYTKSKRYSETTFDGKDHADLMQSARELWRHRTGTR